MFQRRESSSGLHQLSPAKASCPIASSVRSAALLSQAQVEYNCAIRNLIGSRGVALYGAAGAGFSDYHTTIDAPVAFFVSDYESIDLNACLERVARFIDNGELTDEQYRHVVGHYKNNKFINGFSSYTSIDSEYSLSLAMAIELTACGVSSVVISETSLGKAIAHNLGGREYEVYFVQGDVRDVSLPQLTEQIGAQIDVYYHRAAMNVPSQYLGSVKPLLRELFEQMPFGGVFVTDDISVCPQFHSIADYTDFFPMSFDGVEGSLQLEYPPKEVLLRMYRAGAHSLAGAYGSIVRTRRKIGDE